MTQKFATMLRLFVAVTVFATVVAGKQCGSGFRQYSCPRPWAFDDDDDDIYCCNGGCCDDCWESDDTSQCASDRNVNPHDGDLLLGLVIGGGVLSLAMFTVCCVCCCRNNRCFNSQCCNS